MIRTSSIWTIVHPRMTTENLGLLPQIFSPSDSRPAAAQAQEFYAHGGGWKPLKGFTITPEGLAYPGDPTLPLLAKTSLGPETLHLYPHSWVAIIQPDGTFEVSRMD